MYVCMYVCHFPMNFAFKYANMATRSALCFSRNLSKTISTVAILYLMNFHDCALPCSENPFWCKNKRFAKSENLFKRSIVLLVPHSCGIKILSAKSKQPAHHTKLLKLRNNDFLARQSCECFQLDCWMNWISEFHANLYLKITAWKVLREVNSIKSPNFFYSFKF